MGKWFYNADWMKSPNVKLCVYAALAALPTITAALATEGRVSQLTIALVITHVLTVVKAFMSDSATPATATPATATPATATPATTTPATTTPEVKAP